MTQPDNGHPWKFAWKRNLSEEGEREMTETQEVNVSPYPPQDAVSEWLAAHADDMVDCPLGPVGLRILPSACAARQRSFTSNCTCSSPPVLPRDRNGTLLGDADHFQLKGKRGSLAQKYGRKAADAFTEADAPEELKGQDAGSGNTAPHRRVRDTRYVQDREVENWARENDDRELVRDIVRGRVWA